MHPHRASRLALWTSRMPLPGTRGEASGVGNAEVEPGNDADEHVVRGASPVAG